MFLPRVCAFSGGYYCNNCMDVETQLIPARIIYNWDFRKYSVSKRAATFLAEFRAQPFLDLQLLNPSIYFASDAMAELQSLRIRLNFIRAYLYTCAPGSIEVLQNQFSGREYLYEHIHQYSIADLGLIQRGVLCQQLQKAFKLGEAHVLKCRLCQLKGFICEICQSPRVLYPFHISTTYRVSEIWLQKECWLNGFVSVYNLWSRVPCRMPKRQAAVPQVRQEAQTRGSGPPGGRPVSEGEARVFGLGADAIIRF